MAEPENLTVVPAGKGGDDPRASPGRRVFARSSRRPATPSTSLSSYLPSVSTENALPLARHMTAS